MEHSEGKGDGPAQNESRQKEQARPRWHWVGPTNTGILTVVAIVGGYFIYKQLAEMKATTQLTRESLEFAKKSATDGAADTSRALEIADRSAKAAETAAEAAHRQSVLTERSLANRDRPWVVFKEIQSAQGAARAIFKNVGGLPARRLRGEVIYAFISFSVNFPPAKPDPKAGRIVAHSMGESLAFVGAGEEHAFLLRFPMGYQEQSQKTFYVYGTVEYEDLSKKTRSTQFCAFLYDDRWNNCGRHNSAN